MTGFISKTIPSNLSKGLEDNPDAVIEMGDEVSNEVATNLNPIVMHVRSKFEEAKLARRILERTWMDCYRNFRGIQDANTTYIQTEVSKAFIKITKTKVLAAYSQVLEVIFSGKLLPIEIVANDDPVGIEDSVHVDSQDPVGPDQLDESALNMSAIGYEGDGNDLKPGDTMVSRGLAFIKKKFGDAVKIISGEGDAPNRISFRPAQIAAAKMNKRVHRQLNNMRFDTIMRQGLYEACMLGTGIIKGPFNRAVEFPDWDEEGNYTPTTEEQPVYRHVSIWDLFPDPMATNFSQITYIIQRHKLSRSQLRDLKKNTSFRRSAIDKIIDEGKPDYVFEQYELVLNENAQKVEMNRYEVLELWGMIDTKLIEELGIDLGFEIPDGVEELPCNVWVCGNEILRFVLNPLTPTRLPYYILPYEFNPYSVFGVGVAENMTDTQMLMNGFMRLAVDNAVLSGSVMLEVDESVLAPGQDYKVETGKVFRKNAGAPNQRGVQSIQIQNTSQANIQMFDTARRLADEATGIPSFSHGLTGVQGVGRTAGGINQLMTASEGPIKTVVKNVDDYWLEPIGQSIYYWNMQFQFDKELKGDLAAMAKGTVNLMQKEVKAQKLIQFAQVAFPNPALAPWVNAKNWLNEFGKSLDLDIEHILNRPDEAKMQAMIMQAAGGVQNQGSPPNPNNAGQGQPTGQTLGQATGALNGQQLSQASGGQPVQAPGAQGPTISQ